MLDIKSAARGDMHGTARMELALNSGCTGLEGGAGLSKQVYARFRHGHPAASERWRARHRASGSGRARLQHVLDHGRHASAGGPTALLSVAMGQRVCELCIVRCGIQQAPREYTGVAPDTVALASAQPYCGRRRRYERCHDGAEQHPAQPRRSGITPRLLPSAPSL